MRNSGRFTTDNPQWFSAAFDLQLEAIAQIKDTDRLLHLLDELDAEDDHDREMQLKIAARAIERNKLVDVARERIHELTHSSDENIRNSNGHMEEGNRFFRSFHIRDSKITINQE